MHSGVKSFFFFLLCVKFLSFSLILALFSHVMKELIATERIYVDELLSVLLVRLL